MRLVMTPEQKGKIIVKPCFPPIPVRDFDWAAWHDGDEENHCGRGATPEEAVADLARLDQERAEAEQMDSDYAEDCE
jgi:hypothetical protein